MTEKIRETLMQWAEEYNDIKYFTEDPIAFPRIFAQEYHKGTKRLEDVEVAAIFAAHFAWGRRSMIVRDCGRLFDEMEWSPYDYVMSGDWRNEDVSIHRTIKWKDVAQVCSRLKTLYENGQSIESLTQDSIRCMVYGQKSDPKAANKKINMMRRWMVRNDGRVDLGVWTHSSAADLLIPLDVHVYETAVDLGLTGRKSKDLATVREITECFNDIFPGDPCRGDFALFGYGINKTTDNDSQMW